MASLEYFKLGTEDVQFGMILAPGEHDEEYQPRVRTRGKVQHRQFTGYDQSLPMVIYGTQEETIHGSAEDGRPLTLIVFRWELRQRKRGLRFKSAAIRAIFGTKRTKQSAGKPILDTFYDPNIVTVAPSGTYEFMPTTGTTTRTRNSEAGLQVGIDFAYANGKMANELTTTTITTDRITISGGTSYQTNYETDDGDPDRCNVAEWHLFENKTTRGGLPTFFSTAVLLERREGDESRFTAHFTIRAEVDSMVDIWNGFKRVVGLLPRDDPIIFDPSTKSKESGRLGAFKNKLDAVPLEEEFRCSMFQGERHA